MRKVTCDYWKHVKAGDSVATGYGDADITAPSEPGTYTLYELADNNNCHCGWEWRKDS
jgi:hypothetical protein